MITDFVSWQFTQLLIAAACGMALGIFYDIYRLCRYFLSVIRRAVSFFDILWWALAFVLVFGLWFYLTVGDIRFYYIIWQLIGLILYRCLLSSLVFKFGRRLINDAMETNLSPKRFRKTGIYSFLPWLLMLIAKGLYQIFLWLRNSLVLLASGIGRFFDLVVGSFRKGKKRIGSFLKRLLPKKKKE